jgi:type I restriction-modification system DNA methylase subunit
MSKSGLIKSKSRSDKHGEVFTPDWLVNEMLDELPSILFTEPTKTFIDPACGNGNFLVEVVRRKIENGSTPFQALSTTYGVDIMEDNIAECRHRLFKVAYEMNNYQFDASWKTPLMRNIICANALENDLETLFGDDPAD